MRSELLHNRMSTQCRRRRGTSRRGAAVVETVFTLPLMLLFVWGIFEYSRYVMMLQVVNNAAREACRYAVMHTNPVVLDGVTYGNADTDVTNLATNCLGGLALTSQAISVYGSDAQGNSNGVTWQNTQAGQWIAVKITGNFKTLLPTFLHMPASFSVTAESVMRSEAN